MAEVQKRLEELQAKSNSTELDIVERHALHFLHMCGIETLVNITSYNGKDRFVVWAAESIVWTARRARAKEWREFIRGLIQISEYRGRNGGFLPGMMSDDLSTLSLYAQDVISGRKT